MCMCLKWCVCVQYYKEGVQQQIKDTCGPGKERMDGEDEKNETMDNRVAAVLKRLKRHFLTRRKSDIHNKKDQKTKSVQHYSACSQL